MRVTYEMRKEPSSLVADARRSDYRAPVLPSKVGKGKWLVGDKY